MQELWFYSQTTDIWQKALFSNNELFFSLVCKVDNQSKKELSLRDDMFWFQSFYVCIISVQPPGTQWTCYLLNKSEQNPQFIIDSIVEITALFINFSPNASLDWQSNTTASHFTKSANGPLMLSVIMVLNSKCFLAKLSHHIQL